MDPIVVGEKTSTSDECLDQVTAPITQRTADVTSKKQLGACGVCGEVGDGFFFGALVCLPCKSFYVRTLSEDLGTMRCTKNTNNCAITGSSRSSCKACRFNKCLQIGMVRKVRPEMVEAAANQDLCAVCQDIANGVHFGALTCEGCKKFFRRSLKESSRYVCRYNKDCSINPRTRNDCRYCRFHKCLSQGMSKDVKIGRPRKEVVLSLSSQSHNNRKAEISQNNSTFPPENKDSLLHRVSYENIPTGQIMNINHQVFPERQPSSLEPSVQIGQINTKGNVPYQEHPSDKMSAEEHLAFQNKEHAAGDLYFTNTQSNGALMEKPVAEHCEPTIVSLAQNSNEQMKLRSLRVLYEAKRQLSNPSLETVDVSGMKDESFGAYPQDTNNISGEMKVSKHKLSDKENECSCHKLRRLAIENMDVPLPMKTMLIQKMESGKMTAKGCQSPVMPNMLAMMGMSNKITAVPSSTDVTPTTSPQQSLQQNQPIKPRISEGADSEGRSVQPKPTFQNPMNMLGMLEKFKNIKCEFCSHAKDTCDPVSSSSRVTTERSTSAASSPDPEESDAVCLVHCQDSISCPMTFSHIPPSSSNCICLKNIQRQHAKESQGSDDRVTFSESQGMLAEIHIRPGTPETNVSHQFTTMLEKMMDRKGDVLASHKHIHPTPQNCTETIDKLRMLLKVFGIQEITPKPNINFENHVFPPEYWLKPKLPGESIMLNMKNKVLLERIGSAYNHLIRIMHEKVAVSTPQGSRPDQFPMDIVRKRTIRNLSHWITFIKTIPGFVNVAQGDQFTIVRLAGMMGIMLATALHQYDPDENNFTNFYNFEFQPEHPHYHFRHSLLKLGCDIQALNCDFIESALMNACMAIATDFPELESEDILEEIRHTLLEAFRSYTTAKYGTPNGRVEEIFSWIPRLRELGLWNYRLSFSTCFSFEEKASAMNSN